jgi:hypothetical protein
MFLQKLIYENKGAFLRTQSPKGIELEIEL